MAGIDRVREREKERMREWRREGEMEGDRQKKAGRDRNTNTHTQRGWKRTYIYVFRHSIPQHKYLTCKVS